MLAYQAQIARANMLSETYFYVNIYLLQWS